MALGGTVAPSGCVGGGGSGGPFAPGHATVVIDYSSVTGRGFELAVFLSIEDGPAQRLGLVTPGQTRSFDFPTRSDRMARLWAEARGRTQLRSEPFLVVPGATVVWDVDLNSVDVRVPRSGARAPAVPGRSAPAFAGPFGSVVPERVAPLAPGPAPVEASTWGGRVRERGR